jgi:hypothetical protein
VFLEGGDVDVFIVVEERQSRSVDAGTSGWEAVDIFALLAR